MVDKWVPEKEAEAQLRSETQAYFGLNRRAPVRRDVKLSLWERIKFRLYRWWLPIEIVWQERKR